MVLFAWEVELGVERFITASFLALEFYIFIIEQLFIVVLVGKVLQKGSLGISWVILGPGILRLQDGLIIEKQGFIIKLSLMIAELIKPCRHDHVIFLKHP